MKKLLVTSACTLAISLCGTYAANQNGFDVQKLLQASNYTKEAQKVETSTEAQSTNQEDSKAENSITVSNNSDSIESSDITESSKTTLEDNTQSSNLSDVTKDETSVLNTDTNTTAKEDSGISDTKVATTKVEDSATTEVTPVTKVSRKATAEDTIKDTTEEKDVSETSKVDAASIENSSEVKDASTGVTTYTTNNGQMKIYVKNCNKNKASTTTNKTTIATPSTTANSNANSGQTTTTTVNSNANSGQTTNTNNNTAATTAQTATKTSTSSNLSNYANQVLVIVNQERANQGLSALTTTTTLSQAANKRAQETVQSFSHTRPNGTSFSSVLGEFNISYQAAGENIAYGQKTPQEVVTGWMNSPGHRANILNTSFGKIGIGVYQASNGTIYWDQLFTN